MISAMSTLTFIFRPVSLPLTTSSSRLHAHFRSRPRKRSTYHTFHVRRQGCHTSCISKAESRTLDKQPALTSLQLKHSSRIVKAAWRDAFHSTGINTAIDATAGRGSDTLRLCELCGPNGTVHSIDIQALAIDETRSRYESLPNDKSELKTYVRSHENLPKVTGMNDENVAVIAYNLGWLPMTEADKTIITTGETTVKSLQSSENLICGKGGVISVMIYVGHEGGMEEKNQVLEWASKLDKKIWSVVHIHYPNRAQAPHLLICEKV